MNTKRITRLVQLLQTLQSGTGHNAESLAKVCGVSRRTIFRDIDALREAGVPVDFDHQDDCYAVAGGYAVPQADLTAAEALSLVVLARQMGRKEHLAFYEAAAEAASKIESSLPAGMRDQLRELSGAVHVVPSGVAHLDEKKTVYQQLVRARVERLVARIDYGSLTEWETITTKLRTYHLMHWQHSWYVVGRSSLHKAVRTFKLARIQKIEILPERFVLPRGFSLKRYLRNAWRLVPEPGADHDVVIRFAPLVAQNVAEILWHPTQQVEPQPDGSILFQVTVSGVNEISWWILGYADQAQVLKPAKLRKLVAQRARSMVQLYG